MTIESKYNNIIPQSVLFNLIELQEIDIIKIATEKKLIYTGKFEAVKIGNKLHVSKAELMR